MWRWRLESGVEQNSRSEDGLVVGKVSQTMVSTRRSKAANANSATVSSKVTPSKRKSTTRKRAPGSVGSVALSAGDLSEDDVVFSDAEGSFGGLSVGGASVGGSTTSKKSRSALPDNVDKQLLKDIEGLGRDTFDAGIAQGKAI